MFERALDFINYIASKTFPLIWIMIFPLAILLLVLAIAAEVIRWLIGYWECRFCDKFFPFNIKPNIVRDYGHNSSFKYCDECFKKYKGE